MIERAATLYSELFAPEYFLLLCTVALIAYEWRRIGAGGLPALAARLGVLLVGWILAFAIYEAGPRVFETPPAWASDATGSLGLGAGFLLIWLVWRVRDWGPTVPEFALLLVAVTVPHLAITPFWDVSSHVLYAGVPAGYLTFLDRRFAPTVIVPVGMVPGRPLAGAHTWAQSVGGLVLAVVVLAGFLYLRVRTGDKATAEPTT